MTRINYTTRIKDHTRINTIEWKVPNFMNLLENRNCRELRTDKPVEEARQITADIAESRFQLKIQFLGHNNDIIEIYYLSPNSVFLKSTLSACRRSLERFSIATEEYHTVHANKWQYLATLFKSDIVSYDGRDKYFWTKGTLYLIFEFFISIDVKIDRCDVFESQLSNDIENLLHIGMFSDVTMKSVEGVEYKVHKAVLSSRSAVLKANFEHNTTECLTNSIESPLESEVLKEVLTFIYSDKAPKVDEMPEKLLAAADYYQLNRLKSLCEEALHKKLTIDNAVDTLQLADLHSAKTLKELTLEFIKDGQAKHITKTAGWAKVKSVELIKCIYEYIMAENLESDIQ